jgi:hypothetical protein
LRAEREGCGSGQPDEPVEQRTDDGAVANHHLPGIGVARQLRRAARPLEIGADHRVRRQPLDDVA